MKKFLSLVLALVMTMSLVTISAGATEYKDLTDKNEIKYAEAVAVMNKIGIISGYADGSVKPAENLTRGAAAKIVTYMMVGAVAGEQLGVAGKPYKDVALDNPFAPYIAYCKSTGLINGFSDGTFRSGAPLDGYSYSKMLLTAMGYRSANEGFTGSGWQTKVASLAVKSGLYTGNDGFIGSKIVTREEACLYALNLMESVTIEYLGQPNTVTAPDGTKMETGLLPASKVKMENETTSHDYNGRHKDNGAGYIEFCEVHYPQLKLTDTGATDDFYRPANQWAYKNAIIGTYAIDADFTFTKGTGDPSEDADYNAKEFGLKGYHFGDAKDGGVTARVNGVAGTLVKNCKDLATLTGNGTVVELFLSAKDANVITNVVVIKTQLMKINAINTTAKTVTLKNILADGEHNGVNVATVKEDNDAYAALSAMKVDDLVLITYANVGGNNVVTDAVAPTVVTGKLSKVTTKSNGITVKGVTVAGTDYAMSAMWNSADKGLAPSSVSTKTDTTVYIDSFGYAIYVKDFTAATSYIIYDDTYSTLVEGKIHYFANGYDLNGDALSLDFGTNAANINSYLTTFGLPYAYKASTANGGEYEYDSAAQTANVKTVPAGRAILTNDVMMTIGTTNYYFAPGLKFVFAGMNGSDLDGVTVKDGVQAVALANVKDGDARFVLNKDGAISTVVIHNDKDVEVSKNVLYVSAYEGTTTVANKTVSRFTAYIDGVKTTGCVSTKDNGRDMGDKFYTYSVNADGNYVLNNYAQTGKTTSVLSSATFANSAANVKEKTYILSATAANGDTYTNLNAKNAVIIDLTSPSMNLTSFKDMAEVSGGVYTVSMVFNDSTSGNGKGTVSYMVVHNATGIAATQAYVANTNMNRVTFYKDAACTSVNAVDTNTGVAGDTYDKFMAGTTIYAKGVTGESIATITGAKSFTVVDASRATATPIYEVVLGGNITAATTGGANTWSTVTFAGTENLKVNTKADFTGTEIVTTNNVATGEVLYAKSTTPLQQVTIASTVGTLESGRPVDSTGTPVYKLVKPDSTSALAKVDAKWVPVANLNVIVDSSAVTTEGTYTAKIESPFTYVTAGDKLTVAVKLVTAPAESAVVTFTAGTACTTATFTKADAVGTVKNVEFTVHGTPALPVFSVTASHRAIGAIDVSTCTGVFDVTYQIGNGAITDVKPTLAPVDQEVKVILTAKGTTSLVGTTAATITTATVAAKGVVYTGDFANIGSAVGGTLTFLGTAGLHLTYGDKVVFTYAAGAADLASTITYAPAHN